MHSFDITIENLSKMEGHANLNVKIRDGKVQDVEFQILESKRFYEEAVRGQPIQTAPQLMSRICGTCSIAHLLCSIEAIENAVGIQPTEQTMAMKKLAQYGLMIRDHALHLYYFSLPDLIGKDSILDFSEDNALEHQLLHDSFDIKRAGNALSTLIAGKAVHAPFPTVGGFLHYPGKEECDKTIHELEHARSRALQLVETFGEWNQSFERKTDFVGLTPKDFNFIDGQLCNSRGVCVGEKYFMKHLIRVVIPYSQAHGFEFDGDSYMVGALARVNLNQDSLHQSTKRDASKYLKLFPSNNIFHNNLAQSIEILHSIDHSIELLESMEFKSEPLQKVELKNGCDGVGVIEAPRGTLYYKVEISKSGKITHADVIVPTAQNQINIEKDIGKLVQDNLQSHFLKVQWM